MEAAVKLRVINCVADCIRLTIPQAAKRQPVGNQIDAAFIFTRADRHLTRIVIYRIENRRAYVVETPQLMCHAVPEFCGLQKELGGALALDSDDYYDRPWKVRQNESSMERRKN